MRHYNWIKSVFTDVPVAQKEEHGPPKSGVAGSNPARDTLQIFVKHLFKIGRFHIVLHRKSVRILELSDSRFELFVATDERFYIYPNLIRWEMRITAFHVVLFVLTFLTTTAAGAMMQGFSPLSRDIIKGTVFSLPLLFILISHEFGHIFVLWKYGIKSSFPYFIPAPNIIGTFGAIVFLREKIFESSKILKIGAAGPIAGFIATIPVSLVGLKLSKVVDPTAVTAETIRLGSPLIFSAMKEIVLGGGDKDIFLHPVAFAGWIGLFVTSINLIPVGQTDGGHITFSLFPKTHRFLSFFVAFSLLILGFLFWYGWIVWGILTLILGMRTTPYLPKSDIGFKEKLIASISLLIFVLSFVITPIYI